MANVETRKRIGGISNDDGLALLKKKKGKNTLDFFEPTNDD